MDVIIQSFGEFKASQMANAAYRGNMLKRFELAHYPARFEGARNKLQTHRFLRYGAAIGNRLFPHSDISAYMANRLLDWFSARRGVSCDLFVGYSGSSLNSINTANNEGAATVVYRGAPHGRFFQTIVDRELREAGYGGVKRSTPKMTAREQEEFERADFVWVPSNFVAETIIDKGIREDKVKIFPYGIDLNQFYPSEDSTQGFEIIYVGSVTPEKGVHILLEAFQTLDMPDVKLTLIGKIDRRLKNEIDTAKDVTAMGWVDRHEIAKYLNKASIFAFPSLADGYASVVLEALASGCPAIVTDRVGSRNVVLENNLGKVIPANNPTKLAEALELAYRNDRMRNRWRRNAIKTMEEGFSVEQRECEIVELFAEFVKASSTRSID